MPDYYPPPPTLPPGSTVWAYLRDSGGPTQDRSVPQQKEVLVEYCAKHGLVLTHIFTDIHLTGTKDNRDGFREMLARFEHNTAFEPIELPTGLLLWSFARFARNELDSQYYKALLRKAGIIIHSLIEDIPEGKFGIVIEALIDVSNQEKAEQAAWESHRGLIHIVKQGAVPGRPPVGFLRTPITVTSAQGVTRTLHRWDPDPLLVPRLRQAFQMRAAGSSLTAIHAATKLYSGVNCYREFFTNKIYIGTLEFGGLTIENYCPPTIDLPTWNTVQALVAQHTARRHTRDQSTLHPRRKNSNFLLSGLVICGRCGSPLAGNTSHRPEVKYQADRSYRCTRGRRAKDCDLPRIPAHYLENTVIDTLATLSDHPAYIEAMHAQALAQSQTAQADYEANVKLYTADLRKYNTQITRLTNAIAEGGHTRALLEKLTALELDRDRTEITLRELRAQPDLTPPDPDQIHQLLSRLALILHDPATAQTAVRTLLHAITVDRQDKNILLHLDIKVPKKKAPPPLTNDNLICVPSSVSPVGALLYRHTIEGTLTFKPHSKKPRSP